MSVPFQGNYRQGKRFALGLLSIVVLAALLRLFSLSNQDMWGDEACMLFLAQQPGQQILHALASPHRVDVDVAPPLYFLLLRVWLLFSGFSVIWLRVFSTVFGILTVILGALLARKLVNPATAILVGILLASSPFQIWYSQEGRMFALASALIVAAALLLLRYLDKPSATILMGWVLVNILALYTQYYAVPFLFAQIIAYLTVAKQKNQDRRNRRRFILAAVVAFLAFSPWLVVLVRDYSFASESGGFASLFSLPRTIPFLFLKFTIFGNEHYLRHYAWLIPLAFIIFLPPFMIGLFRGLERVHRRWLAVLLFLPIAAILSAATLGLRVYKSHPFLLFHPFFIIFLAAGLHLMHRTAIRILLSAMLILHAWTLVTLNYGEVYTKPRVRDSIAYIEHHAAPGDLVIKIPAVLPCHLKTMGDLLVWEYYGRDRINLRTLVGETVEELLKEIPLRLEVDQTLWLALQLNRMSGASNQELEESCNRRFRLLERINFPSGMRDFTIRLLRYGAAEHDGVAL